MDMMTLAAAKAYTDKQRIGYSENIISSVNGSITPGDYSIPGVLFDTDGSFERASSEYLHVAGAVESVSVYIGNTVPTMQATKPVASMTDDGVFLIMADIFKETKIVAISFNSTFEEAFGAPAGTYLWRGGAMDEEGIRGVVVIGIKGYFKENVHKIDPKYLPEGVGGGLPVLELSEVLNSTTADLAELTDEEIAIVNKAKATYSPILVKVTTTEDVTYVLYMTYNDVGGMPIYYAKIDSGSEDLTVMIGEVEGTMFARAMLVVEG